MTTEEHDNAPPPAAPPPSVATSTAATLAEIVTEPHRFHRFNREWGLTYHTCRFCKRGDGAGLTGLWKYGVRHYACEDCRARIAAVTS